MPVPFSLDTAPFAPTPRARERALIVAPHPDDETLGPGGWIYAACRRGACVRILFLTDGDAFRLAALSSERRVPHPAVCRALGARRRLEGIAAAAALGVDAPCLRFLGYPDRGLSAIRRYQPDHPYRSPHTGRRETGAESALPGRPFSGDALLQDLVSAIEDYRPQYLLYPDPDDDHADHRATAWFTKEALSRIDWEPPWVGRYLIHCGRWPLPHRFARGAPLTPPRRPGLVERRWQRHPLSSAALRAKAIALRAHSSQHPWAADLLGAHLRTNELFSMDSRPD